MDSPALSLAQAVKPCGPVVDSAAALRVRAELGPLAQGAWPALAPVFGAAPYLAGLARRKPERLERVLASPPEDDARSLCCGKPRRRPSWTRKHAAPRLRRLKAELHLLTALADLGGVWDLDQVTGALTRFADRKPDGRAFRRRPGPRWSAAASPPPWTRPTPSPASSSWRMGKHGAFELNYSSDIDIIAFYDPDRLPAQAIEPQALAVRLVQAVAALLHERTAEGYVFRVDLRLRPDPSSTQRRPCRSRRPWNTTRPSARTGSGRR